MHRNCLVVCPGRVGRLSPLYVLKSCSRLADLIEELWEHEQHGALGSAVHLGGLQQLQCSRGG